MQTPTPFPSGNDFTHTISGAETGSISNLPPTTESRKLADLILETVTKIAADNKISLSDLHVILEETDIDTIADRRHPVLDGLAAILQQHEDLFNVWSEAMITARRDISHRLIAENNRTLFGKFLNIIHIR